MSLNPVSTSQKILDRFASYIATSFKLRDETLNSQIIAALKENGRFSKGPIIEATPPFEEGSSIQGLVSAGILTPEFYKLSNPPLPLDVKLHRHQEQAILNICKEKRNVVVATGTGSGKTEAFIIPILEHLLTQRSDNQLTPGIRALLLYPMNALANDQMKRLRDLLQDEPEITFGIYTGETEEYYQDAKDKYQRMYDRTPILNELISREQMKHSPPHILLTNYAMLEYLMLRPADNVFFQGIYSNHWKFIVIDEAHTYSGAKGIEMSMLLARLKSTIGIEKGKLTCIMTSATLGRGREDSQAIADFASKMFHEDFDSSDVIEALKKEFDRPTLWGRPLATMYGSINQWLETDEHDLDVLFRTLKKNRVPEELILQTIQKDSGNPRSGLYCLLSGDERVSQAVQTLSRGAVTLDNLAQQIFDGEEYAIIYAAQLIDLCNQVRRHEKDHPLLPARYHYFIKALEGAFVVLSDKPRLFLNRVKQVTIGETDYQAFEVGACTKCDTLYLIGVVSKDLKKPYSYFIQAEAAFFESDNQLEYFTLIEEGIGLRRENEDVLFQGAQIKLEPFSVFRLCVLCGGIGQDDRKAVCDCVNSKTARVLKVKGKGQKIHRCAVCGSLNPTGSVVRRFYLSEDAVSSVLATALYESLSYGKIKVHKERQESSLFGPTVQESSDNTEVTKASKQLLVFSDSRQSAAYFAPYLARTYQDLLTRNFMVKTVQSYSEECLANRWTLEDYCYRVARVAREIGLVEKSHETLRRDVWKWIIREFAVDTGSNSLENMGLLGFLPDFENLEGAEKLWGLPFLHDVGFGEDETRLLYHYLLEQFRANRAIEYPEDAPPSDRYFSPQNQQGGFWREKPTGKDFKHPIGYSLQSWLPALLGYSNKRSDYLEKVMIAGGNSASEGEIRDLLDNLWRTMTDSGSPLLKFIKSEQIDRRGQIYKLDPRIYRVVPGVRCSDITYYQCDTCYRVGVINLRGVCPTFRCLGTLHEIELDKMLKDNHYRNLYMHIQPERMETSEHTAQLTTEYAADVQSRFIRGDINVLSCSTTFELGVDVGELETVFMKNVPPTPANYAQRAGRAGRRTDSTAYALTLARLSSHDFSCFRDPTRMIGGIVKPPYLELENEKIVKRHLYACAFAMFWRKHCDYFASVNSFFNSNPSGPDLFRQFLDGRPKELLDMLHKVIPKGLYEIVRLDDWQWVEELYSKDGNMTKVTQELSSDLTSLEQAKNEAARKEQFGEAKKLQSMLNTIKSRQLIGYLSQKNLLPKYGFPVDVVSLEVNLHTPEARNIDLSRDLQIAISEYAPESQVVANGKLWTSRYVKRVARRELVRYKYIYCRCGYFRKDLDLGTDDLRSCPACASKKIRVGVFVLPEFGFISESRSDVPGDLKPEKTYSTRKHFASSGEHLQEKAVSTGNNQIRLSTQAHGVLTVINDASGRGFYICQSCGYGAHTTWPKQHCNPYGVKCSGRPEKVSLGYDFETDILEIEFLNTVEQQTLSPGFWESLMYSIIEGMSASLEIDRQDIDGTIHISSTLSRSIILFDTVPGGAGHVKRMLDEEQFIAAIKKAYSIVSTCTCGADKKDTSCYSCLRNYYNQYCHDNLRRDYALRSLGALLGISDAWIKEASATEA